MLINWKIDGRSKMLRNEMKENYIKPVSILKNKPPKVKNLSERRVGEFPEKKSKQNITKKNPKIISKHVTFTLTTKVKSKSNRKHIKYLLDKCNDKIP